jgi:hypothetical protein
MASAATSPTPAVFGRLYWMIAGPFALAICAIRLTDWAGGRLGPLDVIYFLLLGGMLLARRMEFRHGQPLTATGEPATAAHLRRYALVVTILGLGIWVAAKLVASQAIRSLG